MELGVFTIRVTRQTMAGHPDVSCPLLYPYYYDERQSHRTIRYQRFYDQLSADCRAGVLQLVIPSSDT